jgi:hypothetical protein
VDWEENLERLAVWIWKALIWLKLVVVWLVKTVWR